jgi:regulator of sigma D
MARTQSESDTGKRSGEGERRAGTRSTLDKLLAERAEMLMLYCRVAGLEPFEHNRSRAPDRELLQEFCQVLVDYLAAGHFSLYERIANGTERRRSVAETAAQLYPRIADTTQAALDFNDKYDNQQFAVTALFHDDLSKLGELLAARIELEDKLIATLR